MKTFNFDIKGKVTADSRENATATLKTAMIEGDIKDYTIDELVEINLDYCDNCKKHIEQVDLGDGSFGCPHCKRDDCITTSYDSEEEDE